MSDERYRGISPGDKLPVIADRRKPNAPQRRRDLCDAAIELLGADGARGLSHPKVDQRTGSPAGTTSAYYRTRKALLLGVAQRLSELDNESLTLMSELSADGQGHFAGTSGLAAMVVYSGQQPYLTRTRARHELIAQAGRDDDLAAAISDVAARFEAMTRAAVTEWQPPGTPASAALLDEQNFAVTHFIQGVMVDFVRGEHATHSVEHLDHMIQAILAGVRDRHLTGRARTP